MSNMGVAVNPLAVAGQQVKYKYSICSCNAEPMKTWRKPSEKEKGALTRASFMIAPFSNPSSSNNNNFDEVSSAAAAAEIKSKLDASVQTDLMVNIRKLVRKRNSNIFASNLITKISIWVFFLINRCDFFVIELNLNVFNDKI